MHLKQTLKDEKALIIEFSSFRKEAVQTEREPFYFFILHCYQFFIKRLPFDLRKKCKSSLFKQNGFDFLTDNKKTANILRFEISSEKMDELLIQRQICAADIRCLDTNSKQCLKKLCLKNCLYNTEYNNPAPQLLDRFNLADSNV